MRTVQPLFYTRPTVENTPCFVINLDPDTEKWEATKSVAESVGFHAERFSATLGKAVNLSESRQVTTYARMFTEPATIGIFMSHRRLWETVVDRGLTHALIVEDDLFIDLPAAFVKKELQLAMGELPLGWDVVYFGHFGLTGSPSEVSTLLSTVIQWNPALKKSEYRRVTDRLNTPAFPVGLHAYMVSQKACKKLLETTQKITTHVDMTMAQLFSDGGWQVYALERRLLHQSSIKTSGATSTSSGGWWYKHLPHVFSNGIDLPHEPNIATSLGFSTCTIFSWKAASLLTGIIAVTAVLCGAVTASVDYTLVGCGFLLLNALDLINGFGWTKPVVILANTAVCLVCGVIGRLLVRKTVGK